MLFYLHGGDAIESVLFWLLGVPFLLLAALLVLVYFAFKSKGDDKKNK